MEQQEFILFKKVQDEVETAYIIGVFEQEHIRHYIANENMSSMLPIPTFTKKIMVAREDFERATVLLNDELLFEEATVQGEEELNSFELQNNEPVRLKNFLEQFLSSVEMREEVDSFREVGEKILIQLSESPTLHLTIAEAIEMDTLLILAKERSLSDVTLDGVEQSMNAFVESLRV